MGSTCLREAAPAEAGEMLQLHNSLKLAKKIPAEDETPAGIRITGRNLPSL